MPRLVDHDSRRAEVADVAAELISAQGIDAVTVRDVATAVGCSTTVVSHYFSGKRELLYVAYRRAADRASGRLDVVLNKNKADLQGALEALLPLDLPRRQDWRVWCAFFGVAFADPELAAEQRDRVHSTRAKLTTVLNAVGHHDPDAARGIAVQAVFDERDWTPGRQRKAIAAEVDRLLRGPL
jgi:AcrR family transcriptional regulator